MVEYFVLKKEADNNLVYSNAALLEDLNKVGKFNDKIRIKIIELLLKKQMYPLEIAKRLSIHEQKIYYHMNYLEKMGIIEVAERKPVRGTIAKQYTLKSPNFIISLKNNWKEFKDVLKKSQKDKAYLFFEPFISKSHFDGLIVVGSPDPHGPFKARNRDGHFAIELAFFLGQYSKISEQPSLFLDVDIKNFDKNMILVGGPVSNLITSKYNEFLEVKFSEKKPFGLYSGKTGKNYYDESIGMIECMPNPHFSNSRIIILAGISSLGTNSAIVGITRYSKDILGSYENQKTWSRIVSGIDLDGDGNIDSVEIIE